MPINGFLPDCACVLRCVELFAVLWTIACQVPLSMGFFRQESWSGLPFPPSGHLSDPGIKSLSAALLADSLPVELSGKPFSQILLFQKIFGLRKKKNSTPKEGTLYFL